MCVCTAAAKDGRALFFSISRPTCMPVQLEDICNQVCVSSEDVLASAYKDNHARWLAHLIIIIISRDRLYSPPHPRPSLSLSPRSGPGRPAGMDAHSGTFQISFSQGARKAIIRTAVSRSTGKKSKNQIKFPSQQEIGN